MNKRKKVSIIIPVYNASKYIDKCLKSVEEQTYDNLEVLLIDDGSTDDSSLICSEYVKRNGKFKYYRKENGGPSSSRNYGLEKSSGYYCFFCDSDDYLDSNVIEVLVKMTESFDDKTLCGINHKIVKDDVEKDVSYKKNSYSFSSLCESIFNNEVLGCVWGFLFKTEFAKNNSFDENTKCMEDTIFLLKYLISNGVKSIIFSDNSFYYYVNNSQSITNSKKCYDLLENYYYSLNNINEILEYQYADLINDQIIRLYEYLLSLCFSSSNYEKFKKIKISEKYSGNSKRYKFFTYLINKNKYILLSVYFYGLNLIKILKKSE